MNILNKVTIKMLVKNKVRTLVTIIGIILSAAMFTAVTTSISSLQNFLKEVIIADVGSWHGAVFNLDNTGMQKIKSNADIQKIATIQNIGYSQLENCNNEYKPYLFIGGIDNTFTDIMPVHLKDGRLPESADEIILPAHLATNGGVKYEIGDTLELDIGEVTLDGTLITQKDALISDEELQTKLTSNIHRTYKVVGIYERPSFESYYAPGYTALTVCENSEEYTADVYFVYKNPKQISSYLKSNFKDNKTDINSDLLRVIGASNDKQFDSVFYGLGAILIALIMVGSISLIYNAFSISVSERTKQYGLLKSVGATKRQLMRSILTEASFLNIIGIPIGMLAGIAGIKITFMLCENLFKSFLNTVTGIIIKLHVSWEALLIAAAISIITVLISAFIPAKRAMRISVIEAIRQTSDIKIKARKVRTSKLTYKLFGFEGMLATKNFKRNKKKYRATVISLFMSVVLFISASSFSAYMIAASKSILDNVDYDLIYSIPIDKVSSIADIHDKLSTVDGISESGYAVLTNENIRVPVASVNKKYIDYCKNKFGDDYFGDNPDFIEFYTLIYFVQDDIYKEFLAENNLDMNRFMESEVPEATVMDFVKLYDGKYRTFNVLADNRMDAWITRQEVAEDNDEGNGSISEAGENDNTPVNEASETIPVKIGNVVENVPFGVNINSIGLTMMYPFSKMSSVIGDDNEGFGEIYFKADNHKAVYEKMSRVITDNGMDASDLYDYADSAESTRALITVVNIFSYGFIILISLIATANVFNTISTNIALRRREMAMLKSIGMTQKGFKKMMNFECLLYGIKGLIYGLPVSFLITYWIYTSVSEGWITDFFIPWYNVAIAVGSVFAVVFATMLYSMRKINKDNPIDALKNENL